MANFRALQSLIESKNRWVKFFPNSEEFPMDVRQLTNEQAQSLFQSIDADLSPENLHMDGEASMAHVRRQSKLLHGAFADLQKLGFVPSEELWNV